MSAAKFDALDALCREHPEIFAMDASPTPEQLQAFDGLFRRTDYVRGLFEFGGLRKAIEALEGEFAKVMIPTVLAMPGAEREALQAQKRQERETRFIHRVAKIVGSHDRSWVVFTPARQKRHRADAAKHLRAAQKSLAPLLRDDHFKESLTSVSDFDALRRLSEGLRPAAQWIEEARPLYPAERDREPSNTRARVVIDRLADACFRIYGHCDPKIIEHLTEYDWMEHVAELPRHQDVIQRALERKIDAFGRRLPREDNPSPSLRGEWVPATTLDPPWMAG
jgi:hypothetical protein